MDILEIKSLLPAIFSGIIASLVMYYKKQIIGFAVKLIASFINKKIKAIDESTIHNYRKINEILINICNRFKADSVHVIQFHNGQTFVSDQPIWKYSCSHEYVKPGIAPSIDSIQNIQINTIMNVVQCLWNAEVSGVVPVTCDSCKQFKTCNNKYKGLHVVSIEELPNCSYKSNSLLNGCRKKILAPMILNNAIVGYISIIFIGDPNKHVMEDGDPQYLCNEISTLQYVISNSGYSYV